MRIAKVLMFTYRAKQMGRTLETMDLIIDGITFVGILYIHQAIDEGDEAYKD